MKFLKFLDEKLEEYFLVASLFFTVGLIFIQVIMRYVFSSSLSWSEELARYIFLWQIWVGASFAVKCSKHIRVEVFKNLFSAKYQRIIDYTAIILWICFSFFLTYKGAELTKILLIRGQLSPAMRIPMGYAYASVPVGCGLMTFRLIQQFIRDFTSLKKGEERV